jgi:hypothetical protein
MQGVVRSSNAILTQKNAALTQKNVALLHEVLETQQKLINETTQGIGHDTILQNNILLHQILGNISHFAK